MSSPTEEIRQPETETVKDKTPECDPYEVKELLVQLRSRLYRYDVATRNWKIRGTGYIQILRHKQNHTVSVVMENEITRQYCAYHFITPDTKMVRKSEKRFVWSVIADFAHDPCKEAHFKIEFGDEQDAVLWKTKFDEAQEIVRTKCRLYCEEQDPSSNDAHSITRA